jgi:hypothetical protein
LGCKGRWTWVSKTTPNACCYKMETAAVCHGRARHARHGHPEKKTSDSNLRLDCRVKPSNDSVGSVQTQHAVAESRNLDSNPKSRPLLVYSLLPMVRDGHRPPRHERRPVTGQPVNARRRRLFAAAGFDLGGAVLRFGLQQGLEFFLFLWGEGRWGAGFGLAAHDPRGERDAGCHEQDRRQPEQQGPGVQPGL